MKRTNGSGAHVRVPRISLIRAALAAALLILGYSSTALAAGSISGQITSSVTHTGVAGAQVQFYSATDNSDFPVATATANGTGNYSQNLPDGSYAVLTQNTQGYINKIWNNISCSATCDVNSLTEVVVSGGAVTSINFDLSPGGRIAGTITSSATGAPLAGVLVYFIDSGQNVPFSTATTDALGHYISDGGSGTGDVYVITSNGQGYQDEGYNNRKCTIDSCDVVDPVAVTLGATTNGIDFALDLGGRISGSVKDINNLPLANVGVRIYDATGNKVDDVVTDGAGNFLSSGLAAGIHYVSTRNPYGLVDYAWNNFLCAGNRCQQTQGTPISVTVPATTSGIDFVLGPGQTISGTVTAAAGGAPVVDAFVALYNANGAFVGGANTDNAGHYTTGAVPIGTYYANTNATGFVNQIYDHISCDTCPPRRTPIVVFNQPVTNIDFAVLAVGTGSITGTVTDGFNGNLPSGLQVQLFNASGQSVASTNTNAGAYTFSNVAAGSYYVRTNAFSGGLSFINQIYNGVTCVNCGILTSGGTLVTVSNGAATAGINFTLQRGGAISGTITAAATGSPINGIGAQVFNSAGVSVGTFNTNAQGVYTTVGLPAGTYYVRTSNNSNFVNQLWQGQTCPQAGCVVTTGTPVVVNGTPVGGINFALAAGGRISGKVTDASNAGNLQNVAVQFFSSTGANLGSVNTDASGNYTSSGLPAGTYFVRTAAPVLFQFNPPVAVVDQLWNGTTCVPACLNVTVGTPVTVTTPDITPGINFALSRGGTIAGNVIDANTGVGVASVGVQIYTATGALAKTATTDAGGGYTVAGLPPGTYFARTNVGNGVFYQDQLYKAGSCASGCPVTTGTPISVLSNVTSNGVDFALATGAGGISGTVTDRATGAPLPGVFVAIYSSSGVFMKFSVTNFAGMFATSGFAPGTYYARTEVVAPGYAQQLYSGARCGSNCIVTDGTPIVVAAAATTTGIDFALGTGMTKTVFGMTKADFDADGKNDIAVWRASTGTWYVINSSNNSVTAQQWGAPSDVPVPGDYDGDGKTDIAVWRASTGTWYVINSSNNSVTAQQWGAPSDVPVPGDYDGDGKTDIAVWRASTGTWYVINSSNNSVTAQQWGAPSDVPVPGNYDGDGKTDIAVWRPSTGTWYVINSSNNSVTAQQWGAPSDVPVPGEYDGDGKTDIAVWRPSTGTWYVINSSNNSVTAQQWGDPSDVPVPGEYDGDGKTDIAVWRPSTGIWYVINSSNNSVTAQQWGAGYSPVNDVPVPATGVR